MKKGLVVGILVGVLGLGFLILLGVGVFFFLNKSKDEVGVGEDRYEIGEDIRYEDWETYINTNYQLEFRHPADWSFEVVVDNENMLSVVMRKVDLGQSSVDVMGEMMDPFYDINITVMKNDKDLPVKEYYLNQFMEGDSRDYAREKAEEIMVGSEEGIMYEEGVAPASGPATAVMAVYNGRIYTFVYSAVAAKDTHEKYLDVYNRILSSVEFLN